MIARVATRRGSQKDRRGAGSPLVRRVPIGRGPLPSWDETQERRSLRAGYRTAANARKLALRDLFWPARCSRHRHADAPSRGECGMREVDCGGRLHCSQYLGDVTAGRQLAGCDRVLQRWRWRWRATSAKPRGSRSPRSLHDSVARRRESKRSSTTPRARRRGGQGALPGRVPRCGAYTQPRNGKDAQSYGKAFAPVRSSGAGRASACWQRCARRTGNWLVDLHFRKVAPRS